MVLPKEHYRNLFDLDDKYAAHVLVVAKKVANVMRDVLKCEGVNIMQNNEEIAGQTVFHFHMHLIPRYKDDQVTIPWKPGTLSEEVKADILSKIKE